MVHRDWESKLIIDPASKQLSLKREMKKCILCRIVLNYSIDPTFWCLATCKDIYIYIYIYIYILNSINTHTQRPFGEDLKK